MQIWILATKPFVSLLGPDPGSELIIQKNPCTTIPFRNSLWNADWGLIWSSMGGCWNQVSAPLRCLRGWFGPTVSSFAQVTSRTFVAFAPWYIRLHAALTRVVGLPHCWISALHLSPKSHPKSYLYSYTSLLSSCKWVPYVIFIYTSHSYEFTQQINSKLAIYTK